MRHKTFCDGLTDLDLHEACGTDADIDRAAGELVLNVLQPLFAELACEQSGEPGRIGIDLRQEVALADRCLSAIRLWFSQRVDDARGLKFLDFEYAGWDDPAKLACDFFCQPAVPAPHEYFADFVAVLTAGLSDPTMHAERIELLLPVYQVKWCCILLNEFLPIDGRRRQFAVELSAGGDEAPSRRKGPSCGKPILCLPRWKPLGGASRNPLGTPGNSANSKRRSVAGSARLPRTRVDVAGRMPYQMAKRQRSRKLTVAHQRPDALSMPPIRA